MTDAVHSLVQLLVLFARLVSSFAELLLEMVGTTDLTSSGSFAVGALLVTATLVVALLAVGFGPPATHVGLARPRRSIDVSATVPQSDPDAAGHPRSRAPGIAATAA
ncbi:MAG: hypothetical protein J0I70_01325 [Microbacterium sp.]|uniref:DUF6412 domain-containing protein n=1 Tax=Microbacterium sp. TaxID=51671 RepID=UPI001ACB4577|nr:DUF6412 domain-containing protein [Microbacterium sp.]MBN9172781.1 hypothetical protein [Microbacterium sp.]